MDWVTPRRPHEAAKSEAVNSEPLSYLTRIPVNSDAGSQYTSIAHTGRLADIGALPSVGTVATSFDNALAETVNGLFKTELLYNPAVLEGNGGHWQGLEDLEAAICAWVEWFNERRLHGELTYRTPAEVEASYYASHPHVAVA